jgi:hypothetical protein
MRSFTKTVDIRVESVLIGGALNLFNKQTAEVFIFRGPLLELRSAGGTFRFRLTTTNAWQAEGILDEVLGV